MNEATRAKNQKVEWKERRIKSDYSPLTRFGTRDSPDSDHSSPTP
jgi:hypothetical protein